MPHMWPRQRFTCNRSQPLRWTSHRGTWWWTRYFQSILPCQRQNVELRSTPLGSEEPSLWLKAASVTRRWHPRLGRTTSTPPWSTRRWPRAGGEGSRASRPSHLDAVGSPHWGRSQPHWGKKCRVKWCNTSWDPPTPLWRPSRNTKRVWSKYDSLWWMFMYLHV